MSGIHFIPFGGFVGSLQGAMNRAEDALARTRGHREDLDDLRAQVDRLQMICEGMWTLMKEKTGANEDELLRLIEEIDLRDGKVDGRASPAPVNCAMCGRVVSVRTSVCLFCGAKNEKPTVFGP